MAEGLIPFVYRAIKRRKGLRRYHSISSPSAAASVAAGAAAASIVAAAGIPEGQAVTHYGQYYSHHNYRQHQPERRRSMEGPWTPTTLQLGGSGRKDASQHRRWATVDDFAYEEEYRRQQQYYGDGGPQQQQQQPPLAKARSSRVFSCITGV